MKAVMVGIPPAIPDASLAHPMTKRRKPGQLKARELPSLLHEFQRRFGCATPERESCEQQLRLLDEFERIHAAWAEEQFSKAEGFNILRTMRVTRKELCHSNVLAWLLDHRLEGFGTHAQGNRGFRLFLQRLQLPQKSAEADYRVTREASGEESRLDIQKKGAPLREKGEETNGTQRLMEFGGAATPSALKEAPGSVVVGE